MAAAGCSSTGITIRKQVGVHGQEAGRGSVQGSGSGRKVEVQVKGQGNVKDDGDEPEELNDEQGKGSATSRDGLDGLTDWMGHRLAPRSWYVAATSSRGTDRVYFQIFTSKRCATTRQRNSAFCQRESAFSIAPSYQATPAHHPHLPRNCF